MTARDRRASPRPECYTPPCLAIGVAPITLGLAGSLVFNHACDAISFSSLAGFCFGVRCGICGRLPFRSLGCLAFDLLVFYPSALNAAATLVRSACLAILVGSAATFAT